MGACAAALHPLLLAALAVAVCAAPTHGQETVAQLLSTNTQSCRGLKELGNAVTGQFGSRKSNPIGSASPAKPVTVLALPRGDLRDLLETQNRVKKNLRRLISSDGAVSAADLEAGQVAEVATISGRARLAAVSAERVVVVFEAGPLRATEYFVVRSLEATDGIVHCLEQHRAVKPSTKWKRLPDLPMAIPMGEVAATCSNKKITLLGEFEDTMLQYNLKKETWSTAPGTAREFSGGHQGIQEIGNSLYLIGGLGRDSQGKVQIRTGRKWRLGQAMPWLAGSVVTGQHEGKIVACGGIVSGDTTDQCGEYDPEADSWSALPAMPVGVNHAAGVVFLDKFYVMGGRQGGNTVQPGFDVVQILDLTTKEWTSSTDRKKDSPAKMPFPRGGTGAAVAHNGFVYVLGGESSNPEEPLISEKGVFATLQIYSVVSNTWSRGADLRVPRHGLFPVICFEDGDPVIHAVAGGAVKGFSGSIVHETLKLV